MRSPAFQPIQDGCPPVTHSTDGHDTCRRGQSTIFGRLDDEDGVSLQRIRHGRFGDGHHRLIAAEVDPETREHARNQPAGLGDPRPQQQASRSRIDASVDGGELGVEGPGPERP